MAKFELTRVSEYANRVRKIKVFLDDEEIGTISNGETKIFDVPEGRHTLQMKIDWCTSNIIDFESTENEVKQFTLSSFAKHNPLGALAAIYYVAIAPGKYLKLEANYQ